jgi:hypothetical protein
MSVTLIVFSAGSLADSAERMVTETRHAITVDVVARARTIGVFQRIVVATDSQELAGALAPYDVQIDFDNPAERFAFGTRLAQLIERYQVEKAFYIGGGAGALLSSNEMRAIAERLDTEENILLPNNYWSTDFVAFAPAKAAMGLPPLDSDNNLSYLLRTERNLNLVAQPRTVGTQFDVDTPIDVVLLGYSKNVGPQTRAALEHLSPDRAAVERLLPHLTQRTSELLIFGRLAGDVMRYFETQIACRTRSLSEERGLLASGREARGEARSLLGFLFDAYGVERGFALLAEICTAAVLDVRVLLAHRKIRASAHDRFNADLLRADEISDPWLREFTAAAARAPIPVILGGHSLVCGGLYLLVEAAWRDYPPPKAKAEG